MCIAPLQLRDDGYVPPNIQTPNPPKRSYVYLGAEEYEEEGGRREEGSFGGEDLSGRQGVVVLLVRDDGGGDVEGSHH